MPQIPCDTKFDSTLTLLSEGYAFISNQCQHHQSDIVQTRLMLRKTFCMQGEQAARIFYGDERFTRRNAMPIAGLILLQDKGSVSLLDGETHRWRKKMFMSLMTLTNIKQLADEVDEQWRFSIKKWEAWRR